MSGLDAASFLVVYVLLLLCVPSRLVVGPIGAAGTPASLWGMLGLLWWLCSRIGGHVTPSRSPVKWAFGGFLVCIAASYASAMSHGWYAPPDVHQVTDMVYDLVEPTVGEIRAKMISAADRGLLAVAGWAGVLLVTLDGVRTSEQLERLVKWLVVFSTAVAALGVVQFFTGFDIATVYKIPGLTANDAFGAVDGRSVLRRVSSTAIHPIEFGVVVAAVFPLALHRALFRAGGAARWLPVGVIGLAIPMSVSRSAMLVVAACGVALFAAWPSAWRRRALVIVPIAAVLTRLAIPGLLGTVRSLFTNLFNDPSTTGRLDDYDIVFSVWADNPWLGRGLFTFIPQYYRTLDNQVLVTLLELGVVGLVAFGLVLLVGWGTVLSSRRRSADPRVRHLCAALAGALAGLGISVVTFDAFTFPMAAGILFLFVAMSGATWNVVRAGAAAEPARSTDDVVRGPVVAGRVGV